MTEMFSVITVFVPEWLVDFAVSVLLALGATNDPTDGCECLYLLDGLIRFVLAA